MLRCWKTSSTKALRDSGAQPGCEDPANTGCWHMDACRAEEHNQCLLQHLLMSCKQAGADTCVDQWFTASGTASAPWVLHAVKATIRANVLKQGWPNSNRAAEKRHPWWQHVHRYGIRMRACMPTLCPETDTEPMGFLKVTMGARFTKGICICTRSV